MKYQPSIIVVGAGLSGMTAALRLVHKGYQPYVFCNAPPGQTSSVLDSFGFNAVLSTCGQDSISAHIEDTLSTGCQVLRQKPIIEMCRAAPDLLQVVARMGLVLEHDREYSPVPRHHIGSRFPRTYRAKSSLGRQLAQVLADDLRHNAFQGKIKIHEDWEFLSLIPDDAGVCRGIVALNRQSMEVLAFRCDALVLATGGMERLFGAHTRQPLTHTGSAVTQIFLQGGALTGCEFFEFEGHVPAKSAQADEQKVSQSLGGILVDERFVALLLAGIFACGGCVGALHGACSLPGNMLLSSLHSGVCAADAVQDYVLGLERDCLSFKDALFDGARAQQVQRLSDCLDLSGPENIHTLADELAEIMHAAMGKIRRNTVLSQALGKIAELKERFQRASVADKGRWVNREVLFAKNLKLMLELAEAATLSALHRNESRGVHQKPEFPGRNDAEFLKLTVVRRKHDQPQIEFKEVASLGKDELFHETLALKNKTA